MASEKWWPGFSRISVFPPAQPRHPQDSGAQKGERAPPPRIRRPQPCFPRGRRGRAVGKALGRRVLAGGIQTGTLTPDSRRRAEEAGKAGSAAHLGGTSLPSSLASVLQSNTSSLAPAGHLFPNSSSLPFKNYESPGLSYSALQGGGHLVRFSREDNGNRETKVKPDPQSQTAVGSPRLPKIKRSSP